ncbi:OmpA family protein [Thiomonas sp.]
MIAMISYAHHFERPAGEQAQVRVARSGNWELGAEGRVTPVREVHPKLHQPVAAPESADIRPGHSIRWGADLLRPVQSVFFPFNRSQVSKRALARLRSIPPGDYVVIGFASWPGTFAYNAGLGALRAYHVISALRQDGDRILASPVSMGNWHASHDPKKFARDQRATVYRMQAILKDGDGKH